MPLSLATLTDEILKLTDKTHSDFVGWPTVMLPDGSGLDLGATNTKIARNWAAAAKAFFAEMSTPPVNPAMLEAGEAAFKPAMFAVLGPAGSITGVAALAAGFAAFAAALAPLATPPAALPPAQPLVLTPGLPVPDPRPPAIQMATTILAWAKTGAYGPPPAAPVVGAWT